MQVTAGISPAPVVAVRRIALEETTPGHGFVDLLCRDAANLEKFLRLVKQVALRQPQTRIRTGHGSASFRGLSV